MSKSRIESGYLFYHRYADHETHGWSLLRAYLMNEYRTVHNVNMGPIALRVL